MKLPDFLTNGMFAPLKRRMGIPDNVYGSLTVGVQPGRLTPKELDLLTSGEGIDISLDEIVVVPEDDTLAYKGKRVLLYIRDVHLHGHEVDPKYHLCNCNTLREMRLRGRFHRYVIATELTGHFKINIISGNSAKMERRKLAVCQNCLDHLKFGGFSLQQSKHQRLQKVGEFTPNHFFAVYPHSLHANEPPYDANVAPMNSYTSDFSKISYRLREQSGWRCQDCGRVFGDKRLRKFLDVHHVDGNRADNSMTNLQVICVGCHAEKHYHSHLKSDPRYKEYLAIRHAVPYHIPSDLQS